MSLTSFQKIIAILLMLSFIWLLARQNASDIIEFYVKHFNENLHKVYKIIKVLF